MTPQQLRKLNQSRFNSFMGCKPGEVKQDNARMSRDERRQNKHSKYAHTGVVPRNIITGVHGAVFRNKIR